MFETAVRMSPISLLWVICNSTLYEYSVIQVNNCTYLFPACDMTARVFSGFCCSLTSQMLVAASFWLSHLEGAKSPFLLYSELSRLLNSYWTIRSRIRMSLKAQAILTQHRQLRGAFLIRFVWLSFCFFACAKLFNYIIYLFSNSIR